MNYEVRKLANAKYFPFAVCNEVGDVLSAHEDLESAERDAEMRNALCNKPTVFVE